MQKLSLLVLFFTFTLTGCASIDGHHVDMTTELLKGIDAREKEAVATLDTLEKTARRELELKMLYIIGRTIVERFLTLEDKKGLTFDDKVCKAEGVGRSEELLKFTMAMSRKYESRKKKEWQPIGSEINRSRRISRNGFASQRRGLSSLKAGLKAYTKDKKWREDMLRSIGAPVDQATALNESAKRVDKMLKEIGE